MNINELFYKIPIASFLTLIIATIGNYFLTLLKSIGILPPQAIVIFISIGVGILGIVASDFLRGMELFDDIAYSLIIIGVALTLQFVFPNLVFVSEVGVQGNPINVLISLVLPISYTFLGLGLTNRVFS